jgi:hypothetical protein
MDRFVSPKKPNVLILIAGLVSSAVCLGLVYLLNKTGFELMLFFIWHIIPVGAVIVGLGSGLGYAIGSRAANVRVSKAFLGLVFVLAMATYVGAQYLTYLHTLKEYNVSRSQVSFVQYVKILCENMTYSTLQADEKAIELGKLGYVAQGLGLLGFAVGAVVPAWILRQFAYCPTCQLYMTEAGAYYTASAAQVAELKKKKKKEKEAIIADSVGQVSQQNDEILSRIGEAPLDETVAALRELTQVRPDKAVAYIKYELSKCPRCDNHHITATLSNAKPDKQRNTQVLAKLPKTTSRRDTQPAGSMLQSG